MDFTISFENVHWKSPLQRRRRAQSGEQFYDFVFIRSRNDIEQKFFYFLENTNIHLRSNRFYCSVADDAHKFHVTTNFKCFTMLKMKSIFSHIRSDIKRKYFQILKQFRFVSQPKGEENLSIGKDKNRNCRFRGSMTEYNWLR